MSKTSLWFLRLAEFSQDIRIICLSPGLAKDQLILTHWEIPNDIDRHPVINESPSWQVARPTPHRVTIQSIMEQWLINQNAEINLPDLVE